MDEIVFNDIYDKYVNPVWRTALYYSGNQTDAEEITQLTFIQLLISYETIQNKDAIEAWLLTTARRLVYSRKRKAKLETPMCDVELAGRLEKETPGSDELIFMQEHRRKDIEFTNTMLEELYRHNSKWYDAVVRGLRTGNSAETDCGGDGNSPGSIPVDAVQSKKVDKNKI